MRLNSQTKETVKSFKIDNNILDMLKFKARTY